MTGRLNDPVFRFDLSIDGCDVYPSCLTCPLERCLYEDDGRVIESQRVRERRAEVYRLRAIATDDLASLERAVANKRCFVCHERLVIARLEGRLQPRCRCWEKGLKPSPYIPPRRAEERLAEMLSRKPGSADPQAMKELFE